MAIASPVTETQIGSSTHSPISAARIAFGCAPIRFASEPAFHRGVAGLANRIERPADARIGSVQHPDRQVAAVDVLQRQVLGSRCQHLAATFDPAQPPWHPADALIWS